MKKTFILFLCIVFSSSLLFATHNLGGYISYKHISGLTYEVTITTYTDVVAFAADRCELNVDFGDGTRREVSRVNGVACSFSGCAHCGEHIGNSLKINKYQTTHTYSTPNTYLISVADPNRNLGVVNIPNSIQVAFYLEAEIVVDNGFINNSPEIWNKPIRNISANKTYKQSIGAMDLDGDIISYELVHPKGKHGIDVPGYILPGSVYIDDLSGEFVWENPQIPGKYVFTIKASECRNNNIIGYTLFDFEVTVKIALFNLQFDDISNIPKDHKDRFSITVVPNQQIDFDVVLKNKTNHVPNSFTQKYWGEVFVNGNGATCDLIGVTDSTVSRNFKWKPTASHLRCKPYIISFEGEAGNSMLFSNEKVVMIYVRNSSSSNCSNLCGNILSNDDLVNTNEDEYTIQVSSGLFNENCIINVKGKPLSDDSRCIIYDICGKEVKRIKQNNMNEFKIEGSQMFSGIYIYVIREKGRVIGTGKIVKIDG